jgi:hypothetical protein
MAAKISTSWQHTIRAAIKRDPKRAGILGVLLVVLLIVGGKTLMGSATPPLAKASTPANTRGRTDNSAKDARPNARKDAAAMRKWLAMPVKKLDRNLFAAKIDHYPQLSGRKTRNGGNPGKELTAEEKSAQQSADEMKEWHTRTDAMQLEARQLVLTSTVTGASPKALINGQMVREGDVVASGAGESLNGDPGTGFRVLKIEARRVIIEREGIKLEILMK